MDLNELAKQKAMQVLQTQGIAVNYPNCHQQFTAHSNSAICPNCIRCYIRNNQSLFGLLSRKSVLKVIRTVESGESLFVMVSTFFTIFTSLPFKKILRPLIMRLFVSSRFICCLLDLL